MAGHLGHAHRHQGLLGAAENDLGGPHVEGVGNASAETAAPGRMSCTTHSPARISAFSWAIVPARVATAVAPVWAIGPIGTGRFKRLVSKSRSMPRSGNRKGLIGSRKGYAMG